MGRLAGKVAVITGAASGIGRASALRFAAEGAAIVLADLNEAEGSKVASQCVGEGGQAIFERTDVAVEADVQRTIARAVSDFGRLDIMFSNAGLGGATGLIEETTVENWDRTMAVLLRSVFLGIKHSVPHMRQAGGSIISTASVAGLRGGAAPHAYSAAKAAVINLTRSVALELGQHRIRVNCICPGGINTPLIYGRFPGGEQAAGKFLAQIQAIPRAGRPEDIAAMAVFLASDESQWVTGAAMVVDGGLTAGGGMVERSFVHGITVPGNYAGPSFGTE